MQRHIILKTYGKKRLFSAKIQFTEIENSTVINIAPGKHTLRKVAAITGDSNIIIAHESVNEKLFETCKKPATDFSLKTILPILDKICRQAVEKFNCSVPLRDVSILAEPVAACSIISALKNISHLFNVVSSNNNIGKMYDELYFRHGTMIRHIPCVENITENESLIIRLDTSVKIPQTSVPVINLSGNRLLGKNVVDAGNIYISDELINQAEHLWGGKSNIVLFELLGLIPNVNSCVDINKTADKIFLLDREKI